MGKVGALSREAAKEGPELVRVVLGRGRLQLLQPGLPRCLRDGVRYLIVKLVD